MIRKLFLLMAMMALMAFSAAPAFAVNAYEKGPGNQAVAAQKCDQENSQANLILAGNNANNNNQINSGINQCANAAAAGAGATAVAANLAVPVFFQDVGDVTILF